MLIVFIKEIALQKLQLSMLHFMWKDILCILGLTVSECLGAENRGN